MLRDVTNVSAHIDAYKKIGADTDAVPFGRIRRDIVLSAQEILFKLEPLVRQKGDIETKRFKNPCEELNRRLFETVQRIHELTSQYYHLMPKKGYEYVKLQPVDNKNTLQEEMSRVKNTLELEAAERLILAAQYRDRSPNASSVICQWIKSASRKNNTLLFLPNNKQNCLIA